MIEVLKMKLSDSKYSNIGEKICNKFVQTLFGCANLHDLSRESFKPDFVKNLILQHNERNKKINPLQFFTKELGLMEVIAFTFSLPIYLF